ncbi:RNA polymerase subunit sigma [Pseudomonas endophytica]|uniref:RNA polymerase subunit sigma n=1 Tax=Pseudomonas endophytica TaxID=1563157 RepID=A0A0Q0X9T0_9PSED|nr:RNA polymerase sigma factor [Pseudomonas endophytica]KQB53912.1 RNA polymerase subunit sigma [Pseudomonas endophytica]
MSFLPTAYAPTLNEVVHDLLASYSELRRYLCSRLGNPDDAADIAQSSFAQAYAYALNSTVANPRALLFKAARNACIDQYRRHSCEVAALDDWMSRLDVLSPTVEEIVIAREQLQQLIERIERMPRLRREVFVRVRLEGYSHRQVCAELGLSAKSVELHIARAVFDLSELSVACRHV